jgi:dienelactone hydrolase
MVGIYCGNAIGPVSSTLLSAKHTSPMMMPDPNVRSAISHWAPRFIANGIDYNDFQTTTARVERWEQWSEEWSRTAVRHEHLAAEAEERGCPASAAEALVRAALCHHFGKFVFFEDPEQYERANRRTVENYRRALAHLNPPAEAIAIAYQGAALPGYLRKPSAVDRPPVVIIICGLDSVKEEMNAFEEMFHRGGMATVTFDGPGQGESEALPIEPAFEKAVGAVIDWIAARVDLDGGRIAAVGISLGGYYAGRAAAYETRLTCAVSVGGPYDFGEAFTTTPALTQKAFQVRSHSADLETARHRAEALTLREAAPQIEMPFLVVFGKQDRLIPYQQAKELFAAIRSRDKRLELYEDGNHVCNNIPFVYRPFVRDWVAQRLGTRSS